MSDMANRFNTGKPKLSRVMEFGPVIDGIARIMEFGDIKYGRYNWQKGLNHTEIADSLLRHMLAWMEGQDRDPESGQYHTEHMVVNAMMLCYNQLVGVGIDDRCSADEVPVENVQYLHQLLAAKVQAQDVPMELRGKYEDMLRRARPITENQD